MGVTSGSFNTNPYESASSSPTFYTFSWSLISQNIEGNYSDISWSLKGAGGSSDGRWVQVAEKYVTVDGETHSSSSWQQTYNGTVAFSGTKRIYHNADGKKSFSASAGGAFYYSGSYNSTGSGSWELPQIPRASTINSFYTDNDNIEYGISVNYTAYYSGFTNKLRVSIPKVTVLETIDNYPSGRWFELSKDTKNYLYGYMTNSNSVQIGVVIETWNGNTKIGESEELVRTLYLRNANPVLNAVEYADTNPTTIAITGNNQRIIRNNSKLTFYFDPATAQKGATISKYQVTIAGQTKVLTGGLEEGLYWGTVNLSSNTTAKMEVIDSRGNSASKEISIIIDDWVLPSAIINLNRKNNFYSETYIKADGSISSLNGKNSMTITCQYKKISDSNYTSILLEDNVQKTLELDNNYKWNISIIIRDKIGSTTYNLTLDRGMPIIFFDRLLASVGINCFPKKATSLEVDGDIEAQNIQETILYDGLLVGGTLETIILSDNAENYDYLEMFMTKEDNSGIWSVKVPSPNGKTVQVGTQYYYGSGMQIVGKTVTIDGNEILHNKEFYMNFNGSTGGINDMGEQKTVKILKVIGWK